MNLRNSLCSLVVLTVVAIQPALAAGAPAAKPKPAVQAIQLADVPMTGLLADDPSASTLQTTSQDNVGFNPGELFEPKACPQGGNATFTWTITDGCGDGLGLYVRFFDETNNLVFPNSSQVYIINSGRTSAIKLSAKRGAKICYGAEPSNRDGYYWGVSLDDSEFCSNCCNIVPNSGNISRSVRLICN
jgi:hypothetical protein